MSHKKFFPQAQSFGAAGLFRANPDIRPKPLSCRRCYERPTAYRFCDETGHNVQPAGLCKKCQRPQTPTADEIMLAEVEAFNAERPNYFTPIPLEEVEQMAREADESRDARNRQWLADWELLAEMRIARRLGLHQYAAFIASEHPYLEDADFGLTDNPPHPFNAPFIA